MAIDPEDVPEGYALIPIGQLDLAEAVTQAGREFWLETMPPILQGYPSITPDAYWKLTVAEHAQLVAWLQKTGAISDGNAQS